MKEVAQNLSTLKNKLPEDVTLVAVSKTKPKELIVEAYQSGHLDFGENKVQEAVEKASLLPKDIKWHFIGHLQRNKVKQLVPFVYLIHSVDSERLLAEINKQAQKVNRVVNCLIQVYIAKEDSKFGFSFEEAKNLLSKENLEFYPNVKVMGVMGMATNTSEQETVKKEFDSLFEFYNTVKNQKDNPTNLEFKI